MANPPSVPKPDLHGSINHVSITVSDLPQPMRFFGPLLKFLGCTVGAGSSARRGNSRGPGRVSLRAGRLLCLLFSRARPPEIRNRAHATGGAELPPDDRRAGTRVALIGVVVSPVSRKMPCIYCDIKRKCFT